MSTPLHLLLTIGELLRLRMQLAMCFVLLLSASLSAQGQITIKEINPDRANPEAGASSGRVNGLAVAPRSNQVFYAATEWGGLYKTIDGGRTWTRLNGHLPTVTWDVEVSPSDANRVIATSFYDGRVNSRSGINVSTDGGNTWSHPPTAKPPAGLCRDEVRREELAAFGISFDRFNTQNVFVGTNCGLAISNNAGTTWRFVDPTPGNGANNVSDVVVHHGGIIDLCGDDGHRRSIDGGATWTTAGFQKTPLTPGRCSIAASPDEPHVLFAVIGSGVVETDNGGEEWNAPFANPDAPLHPRVSPFVATNRRTGASFNLWSGAVRLFRADCTTRSPAAPGGPPRCPPSNTWTKALTGAHPDAGDIAFDARPTITPPDPRVECRRECDDEEEDCRRNVGRPGGRPAVECARRAVECERRCNALPPPRPVSNSDPCPLLFSNDGGVYFNTKATSPGCHTPLWEQPNVTPHALWLWAMTGVPRPGAAAEDLYFGTMDNGSFATTNAGATSPTWLNRDGGDVFDVSASTTRVFYTILGLNGSALLRRESGMIGGGALSPESLPPGGLKSFTVTFIDIMDRFGPQQYVMVNNTGVFVTANGNATPISWSSQRLGGSSTPSGACGIRASGPTNNPTFYLQVGSCRGFTRDLLFKYTGTSPGGTWRQVQPPGGEGGFGIFNVDPRNPDRLLASHITPTDVTMVQSSDGGATWKVNTPLTNLMMGGGVFKKFALRGPSDFDPFTVAVQPTLVAHDPFDPNILIAGGADSGLFLSRNGGATWTVVTDNSGTAAKPQIPRPRFAYFSHEGCRIDVYVGTQGRGVWRLSFPAPRDEQPTIQCQENCEEALQTCLREVGEPGGSTIALCRSARTLCIKNCPKPCP